MRNYKMENRVVKTIGEMHELLGALHGVEFERCSGDIRVVGKLKIIKESLENEYEEREYKFKMGVTAEVLGETLIQDFGRDKYLGVLSISNYPYFRVNGLGISEDKDTGLNKDESYYIEKLVGYIEGELERELDVQKNGILKGYNIRQQINKIKDGGIKGLS